MININGMNSEWDGRMGFRDEAGERREVKEGEVEEMRYLIKSLIWEVKKSSYMNIRMSAI